MPQTIALSLISHTNVGKTTLARTLLGRDVGDVRDEAHVTMQAEAHLLIRSEQGDELTLWDTPGFGDSHRLAKRLAATDNALGWFLTQVWDRYRARALFASQQAVRNVRESSDLVLYLVNASEDPQDASYVTPELQILQWIGKPVIVLLNQLGQPQPAEIEQAQIDRWHQRVADVQCVRGVLALDAFARCWVQEAELLALIERTLEESLRAPFSDLRRQWLRQRRAVFDESVAALADRITRAASDSQTVESAHWSSRVRELAQAIGLRSDAEDSPWRIAMSQLAERLDADIRAGTDRLIALHGLHGQAAAEVLSRLAEHFAVREPVSESKAAAVGGIVTGALAGLKADLASGGLTFGAGLLVGGVLGALGAAGLAHGYNLIRGAGVTLITWNDEVLEKLLASALLSYLAVAHYGRGRGDWSPSEHPAHWQQTVSELLEQQRSDWRRLWSIRKPGRPEQIAAAIHQMLLETLIMLLRTLYPQADLGDEAWQNPSSAATVKQTPDQTPDQESG